MPSPSSAAPPSPSPSSPSSPSSSDSANAASRRQKRSHLLLRVLDLVLREIRRLLVVRVEPARRRRATLALALLAAAAAVLVVVVVGAGGRRLLLQLLRRRRRRRRGVAARRLRLHQVEGLVLIGTRLVAAGGAVGVAVVVARRRRRRLLAAAEGVGCGVGLVDGHPENDRDELGLLRHLADVAGALGAQQLLELAHAHLLELGLGERLGAEGGHLLLLLLPLACSEEVVVVVVRRWRWWWRWWRWKRRWRVEEPSLTRLALLLRLAAVRAPPQLGVDPHRLDLRRRVARQLEPERLPRRRQPGLGRRRALRGGGAG